MRDSREGSQPTFYASGTTIDRFRLEDLVTRDIGGSVWRAIDERLGRTVMVRVVGTSDPRIDEIRQAACAASRVSHRGVVQVLDVLATPEALVIISEWIDGVPLGEVLNTAMTNAAAVRLTIAVATAVGAIHTAGTSHGRITPNCVLVDDRGQVKLRGHVVDTALWGTEMGLDPVSSDLVAIGSILLACLTARWPQRPADGLRAAPLIGGMIAAPGQLVADVPAALDRVFLRAIANVPGPRTPHTQAPYRDVHSLTDSLALAQHELAQEQPPRLAQPRRRFLRRSLGVIAGLAVAGLLGAGGIGLVVATRPGATNPRASVPEWHAPPTPTAEPSSAPARLPEQALPITRVWELGSDAASNLRGSADGSRSSDAEVAAAIDANPVSAWHTPTYRKPAAVANDSVGLVVDLGQLASVQAFDIGLLGDGADIAVGATTEQPTATPLTNVLARINGATPLTTLRIPRPVTARYVVIWFLRVPGASSGYRGGITNITVSGSPAASPQP